MALTTEYANSILKNIFNGAFLGLSTTAPATDGSGVTEPSGGGYARILASSVFSANNKVISNTSYLYFPEATAAWGVIAYLCVFPSLSGGKPIYYGALTSAITVNANTVPLFRPNTIQVSLDA